MNNDMIELEKESLWSINDWVRTYRDYAYERYLSGMNTTSQCREAKRYYKMLKGE